ncbi:MAG: TauD/TfdA family dioxygenase [Deltaproteobacteria bacterium]|nr:TauD/TfdA family dioxygenase [Deltaproteobacteria bacterium]
MQTSPAPVRAFTVEPLRAAQSRSSPFGAIVRGVRLPDLDDAGFRDLYALWLEYALLVFPDQHLTKEEQVAFADRFGPREFPLAPISNVLPDGSLRDPEKNDEVLRILKGNQGWHADSTYMPIQAKAAVFTAHVVPDQGGETEWADMRAAYDALDPALRARIADLTAYHSIAYSQIRAGLAPPSEKSDYYGGYGFEGGPAPLRPLVKVHPETGRSSLLIGRHAHAIPGLDPDESEKLLDALVDFACQPPRVYRHAWQPGDAVVWDNRCLLHRGLPWDMREARVMYHARVKGDPVAEAALGADLDRRAGETFLRVP